MILRCPCGLIPWYLRYMYVQSHLLHPGALHAINRSLCSVWVRYFIGVKTVRKSLNPIEIIKRRLRKTPQLRWKQLKRCGAQMMENVCEWRIVRMVLEPTRPWEEIKRFGRYVPNNFVLMRTKHVGGLQEFKVWTTSQYQFCLWTKIGTNWVTLQNKKQNLTDTGTNFLTHFGMFNCTTTVSQLCNDNHLIWWIWYSGIRITFNFLVATKVNKRTFFCFFRPLVLKFEPFKNRRKVLWHKYFPKASLVKFIYKIYV